MRYLLLALLLGVFAASAHAQTPADAFKAKDYTTYLTSLPQELRAASFTAYQRIGIALAKTEGWDGAAGKQARELLKGNANGLRQLEAAYLLAHGETRGLAMLLLDGPPPVSPEGFPSVTRLYREHSCEVAASACDVVYSSTESRNALGSTPDSDKARAGMQAWARIPADQMPPLTRVMEWRFANNPMQLSEMVNSLEGLLGRTELGTEREGLGRVEGELCVLRKVRAVDVAMNWARQNRPFDATIALAAATTQRDPGNAWMVLRALQALDETKVKLDRTIPNFPVDHPGRAMYVQLRASCLATALSLCQAGLKRVPEPDLRDVRLAYLTFLRDVAGEGVPGAVDPATLQANPDPLYAADALLIGNKLAEAAAQYRAVLNGAGQPLARRLYAWAGLLDADPAVALGAGTALLAEIGKLEATARTPVLQWYAWHLWQAVSRDVSLPKGDNNARPIVPPYRLPVAAYPCAKVGVVPDGYAQAATLLDQALALDAAVLLKPDPTREWMSLRFGAAMIYLLAGQAEKGGKIAWQRVEETVPAPPWGWRHGMSGMPLTDANKPRRMVYPDENEPLAFVSDLVASLQNSTIDARQGAEFCGYLAPALWGRIRTRIRRDQPNGMHFAPVAPVLTGAVALLERDAPPAGPDVAGLAPLITAVKGFMDDPFVRWSTIELAQHGIVPALREAKTDQMRMQMLDLVDSAIQVIGKETGMSARSASIVADNLAGAIEVLRDDLRPYGQRLREKYPRP